MNTNVNLMAPAGALALLGTAGILIIALIFLMQSLIVRKFHRAKIVLIVIAAIGALYLAAMIVFSIASHEKLLAQGEEKHFCELDCHLAYSVVGVRQAKTIGSGPGASTARGMYLVVTIRTRFDETTIAPWRGNGFLYPNNRQLTLIDQQGNRHVPISLSGTPLTTPLRPGESYQSELVFDLPADTGSGALRINESDWVTHLVIGHENSLLHKQVEFRVDLPATTLTKEPKQESRALVRSRLSRLASRISSRLRNLESRVSRERSGHHG